MPIPTLDEHHGIQVLKRAAGILEPGDALLTGDSDRDAAVRRLFGRYREVMAEWAAGGYADETIEPWRDFRSRAAAVVAPATRTDLDLEPRAADDRAKIDRPLEGQARGVCVRARLRRGRL